MEIQEKFWLSLFDYYYYHAKMNVLNVMSLLIELLGNQMKPFLGTLLQLLPALWDASQEHNLLRCAIISTLVHVVKV